MNRIENKAETIEAEHDIAMAWEAVGGNENKIDTIRVSELQQWSDQYNMRLNFQRIITDYYRGKNIFTFSTTELGYQVFKEIMLAACE